MMRNRVCAVVLAVVLASPAFVEAGPASAQNGKVRDSLWNGMLIGASIGAAVGMFVAPQAYCGSHDTECATIVRVAIGLPAIAGGLGVGALVDGLMARSAAGGMAPDPRVRRHTRGQAAGPARLAGVQLSWTF